MKTHRGVVSYFSCRRFYLDVSIFVFFNFINIAGILHFYFANIRKLAAAWALFNGMLKSILFGIVVATISCYQGMKTEGGAEAVGRAVNTCLVHCSIAIFLLDYIIASLAALTFGLAEEIIF